MKSIFRHSLIIIFLMLLTFISSFVSAADGELNDDSYKKFKNIYNEYGDQKANINALTANSIKKLSLNHERVVSHDPYMNFKLKGSKITSQNSTGRCWMFAGGNVYAPRIISNMKLSDFEISESYLAFWDKMEKSNLFLERMIKYRDKDYDDRALGEFISSPLGDGGWWNYFTELVAKYGIVPISAMPETHHSKKTGEVNKLATTLLRKGAAEIRQLHKWGKSIKEMRNSKEETLAEIYRLLIYTYGTPPKDFEYRYESTDTTIEAEVNNYTPHTFASKFLGDSLPDYVALINNPTREFNKVYKLEDSRNLYEKDDITALNLTSDKLQEYTLASLKDSQVVWFACDVGKGNYNDSGIFSVDIYEYNRTLNMDFYMSKTDKIHFGEISTNHAMVILGADTTDNGLPEKWLVENSWGTKKGIDGYWQMYDQWFDEFVFLVIIDKKLLSKEDARIFEETPVIIPPWEPFFSALRKLNYPEK